MANSLTISGMLSGIGKGDGSGKPTVSASAPSAPSNSAEPRTSGTAQGAARGMLASGKADKHVLHGF